ncbi:hypothetical protein QQF64_003276 [Cirrhinus molitorella]|uniref:Uncharacterized protein n=1 Tax=Cirrhinus molitorella TaxID=172907 RepID=A0ABR3MJK4_9TELE
MPAFSKRVPALLQSLPEPDGLRLLRSEATLVAPAFGAHCREKGFQNGPGAHSWQKQVPPRFELGSLDSESRVLTITPWNHDRLSSRWHLRCACGGSVRARGWIPVGFGHRPPSTKGKQRLPKPGIEPGTFRSSV